MRMLRTALLALAAGLIVTQLPAVAAAAPATVTATCNGGSHYDRDNGGAGSLTTRFFATMPSVDGYPGCTLSYGHQNRAVRYLKIALNRCHGARLAVNDTFDSQAVAVMLVLRPALGLPAHPGYDLMLGRRMAWPANDDIAGGVSCQRMRFFGSAAAARSARVVPPEPVCNMSRRLPFAHPGDGWFYGTRPWNSGVVFGDACYEAAGADNRGVMYLKVMLNRCHGSKLPYTWTFDRQTVVVVNLVRKKYGLAQNGRYDQALRRKITLPLFNDLTLGTKCGH